MLNTARLKTLCEVARRGSFSAAAEALDYTQSAVSQQIATLEAETGSALLQRHGRGVRLTAAGQTLVAHADGILARLEAAEAALGAIAGLRGGSLRMASFPSAGGTLMPAAIAAFRDAHPLVELSLAEADPQQLEPRLQAGELDLALLFEFADGPRPAEGTDRHELLDDPLHLALPAGHRLAARDAVELADLADGAWIQTSLRSPCARQVVRSCHAAGFDPHVTFESDDYQTIQGLVAAGVGVALIPQLALSPLREGVVIRPLSPAPLQRRVFAATPQGARLVPAAPAMLEILGRLTDSGRPADVPGAPIGS